MNKLNILNYSSGVFKNNKLLFSHIILIKYCIVFRMNKKFSLAFEICHSTCYINVENKNVFKYSDRLKLAEVTNLCNILIIFCQFMLSAICNLICL